MSASTKVQVAVLRALARLDGEDRGYGGLVPFPVLRAALRVRRSAVDDALVELEADFVIDLHIAQSPTEKGIDRAAGIWREGRGLLYYAGQRGGDWGRQWIAVHEALAKVGLA